MPVRGISFSKKRERERGRSTNKQTRIFQYTYEELQMFCLLSFWYWLWAPVEARFLIYSKIITTSHASIIHRETYVLTRMRNFLLAFRPQITSWPIFENSIFVPSLIISPKILYLQYSILLENVITRSYFDTPLSEEVALNFTFTSMKRNRIQQ